MGQAGPRALDAFAASADPERQALDALASELDRARRTGPRDRALLDALLNLSPQGVLACDTAGRMTVSSRGAEQIWRGAPRAESVGDWRRYRAFHPDGRPFEPEDWSMARALRTGEATPPEEIAFERFDGTRGVMLASAAPMRGPAGEIVGAVGVFADITELKHLQDELLGRERHAAERAERLLRVTAALAEAITPEQAAEASVSQGRAALAARTGAIWIVSAPGEPFADLVSSEGYREEAAHRFARIPLDPASPSPVADVIRSWQPRWIESRAAFQAAYPDLAEDAVGSGVGGEYAIACLPLVGAGRCLGAIAFSFDAPRPFDAQERSFLLVLTRHCALALERARLYDAERRARADAEAAERRSAFLSEASGVLASSLDYETTLASVARLAVPGIADWCAVDLADSFWRGEPAVVVAHAEPAMAETARDVSRRYPPDREAPRGVPEVLRTGRPELYAEITDAMLVAATRNEDHLRIARELRMRSAMIVPMPARGRTLGAITFISTRDERRYGPPDLEMAQHLARRAALAVDNARLYRDMERAVQARDEVLAVVSHDLKNPLGAILMSAVLLQRGSAEPQRVAKHATTIQRSADRMERLIRDLLDLSAMDAGKFRVERAPVDGAALLAEAVALLQPLAVEKGLSLDAPTAGPAASVLCDRDRVLQVFSNLVGNAVAFTPANGSVSLAWSASEGSAVFSVADTGSGIPEKDQAHVFDRFWRSAGSRRGSGLGLSIARGIVEAHGGSIWFESAPGRGTTFFFTLPLADRADAALEVSP